MHLIDALSRQDRITPVAMPHEQGCAIASDGFNQYHNGLKSVVCVTSGPGGTNTITGVVASWIDSIPLLVISGQVPTNMMMSYGSMMEPQGTERQRGPQEVAITSIVRPITKHASVVGLSVKPKVSFEEAVAKALEHPRGPVWLDIPLDVQGARCE